MSRIGYIFNHTDTETWQWLDNYGLDTLLVDKGSHEQTRPKLNEALSNLMSGDELVLAGFGNALRSFNELPLLIDLCRLKGVRLISKGDRIDTKGELFAPPSPEEFLNLIASIPKDIIAMRQSLGEERLQQVTRSVSDKKTARQKRDHKVVNLYLAGHSLDMIMKQTGIKHTSLYNILKRNGIKRDRIFRRTNLS